MRTTRSFWLMPLFLITFACAEGDDDSVGDDGAETGSAGEEGGGESTDGGDTNAMSASSTTYTTTLTTSDDGGETGDATDGGAMSCEEYCDIYLGACADFTEYANVQHCLDNCAQWPIGSPDDTGQDSLGCRLYHATVASTVEPGLHCPHAGPSGDSVCVQAGAPTCDLYCDRYFTNCNGDLNTFTDMGDCMSQCGGWYPGTAEDTAGHTIGCHAYHAGAAAADAALHCPHSGAGGDGICVL